MSATGRTRSGASGPIPDVPGSNELDAHERTLGLAGQGGEMPLRLHDDLQFCAIGDGPPFRRRRLVKTGRRPMGTPARSHAQWGPPGGSADLTVLHVSWTQQVPPWANLLQMQPVPTRIQVLCNTIDVFGRCTCGAAACAATASASPKTDIAITPAPYMETIFGLMDILPVAPMTPAAHRAGGDSRPSRCNCV
jgi:hypothetical protein